MKHDDFNNIYISVDNNMVPMFFFFLEKGVKKEIKVGLDIKAILSDQLNLSEDYIDNRIKTMFLDGRPVGDINSTIINNGAILALSAAMPGLAGATFRRMENTKPSESEIDKKERTDLGKLQSGIITIKFFNLVLRELGPAFLKSGVLISKYELTESLLREQEKFKKAFKSARINGRNATIEALTQIDVSDDSELLQVYIIPE